MRVALLATITLAALAPIIWLTINELRRQHRFKHTRAARQRDYDAITTDESSTNP